MARESQRREQGQGQGRGWRRKERWRWRQQRQCRRERGRWGPAGLGAGHAEQGQQILRRLRLVLVLFFLGHAPAACQASSHSSHRNSRGGSPRARPARGWGRGASLEAAVRVGSRAGSSLDARATHRGDNSDQSHGVLPAVRRQGCVQEHFGVADLSCWVQLNLISSGIRLTLGLSPSLPFPPPLLLPPPPSPSFSRQAAS